MRRECNMSSFNDAQLDDAIIEGERAEIQGRITEAELMKHTIEERIKQLTHDLANVRTEVKWSWY
jgi:hypothetical protein